MTETHPDPARSETSNDRWSTNRRSRQAKEQPALHRFLGGSPAMVFVRLLLVSAIVGAFLMWLRIRPIDIFLNIEDLIRSLWNLGFDAIRRIAEYLLAGAIIVVPIWFVVRLLNFRDYR